MPTSVAFVAIAGMATFLVMIWMINRAEIAKARAKTGSSDVIAKLESALAETSTEMARLRDRVAVLERLATDEDRRVASEISRLGGGPDGLRG